METIFVLPVDFLLGDCMVLQLGLPHFVAPLHVDLYPQKSFCVTAGLGEAPPPLVHRTFPIVIWDF